jgi:hypothetical protein
LNIFTTGFSFIKGGFFFNTNISRCKKNEKTTFRELFFIFIYLGVSLLLHYFSKLQPSCDHDVVNDEVEFASESLESVSLGKSIIELEQEKGETQELLFDDIGSEHLKLSE